MATEANRPQVEVDPTLLERARELTRLLSTDHRGTLVEERRRIFLHLHDERGWSWAAIGEAMGLSETAARNACDPRGSHRQRRKAG